MAKLEITLDTDSGDLSVSVDGTAIPNVGSVNVSNWRDEDGDDNPHFEIVTYDHNGSYHTRTCLTASQKDDARFSRPSGKYPGLFENREMTATEAAFAARFGV